MNKLCKLLLYNILLFHTPFVNAREYREFHIFTTRSRLTREYVDYYFISVCNTYSRLHGLNAIAISITDCTPFFMVADPRHKKERGQGWVMFNIRIGRTIPDLKYYNERKDNVTITRQ